MADIKQGYLIKIQREDNGYWSVKGYWEIMEHHYKETQKWDLDGAPRYFKTRTEAFEFASNQSGIPE